MMQKLSIATCAAAAATSSVVTALVLIAWQKKQNDRRLAQWKLLRQQERTGRIRAEIQLRTLFKKQKATNINHNNGDERSMTMKCIATVVSPFTKRMGTPRQPQLVPSSRGMLRFSCPPEALSGLADNYSHVWIFFQFHANTNILNNKTKIRPPRAPGKVGMLATRSPHRPNPIGLSLLKVDKLDGRDLHVRGLDVVNGTPVYDIKPAVPWDIPENLLVPDWVSQQDELAEVTWEIDALSSLQSLLQLGQLTPLYDKNSFIDAKATLDQVLVQDPRASHRGLKVNARGSTATAASYSLVFCDHCQVDFVVNKASSINVVGVSSVSFCDESYVDGVPLVSENNKKCETASR